jgi:hypothetical protein
MATDKKSFLLYADYMHTILKLPDAKAGKLFKMILEYVNDKNPTTEDILVDIAFEPIKQQLKRDLKHWENKKVIRSEAGKKGGIKSGEARNKANEANASKLKQNEANEAVTVNDTVTVNVINNNVVVEEEEIEKFKTEFSSTSLCRQLIEKQKILREKIPEYIELFIEQKGKDGFDELKNKSSGDMCKNFYYWLPKYIRGQTIEKEKHSGQKEKVDKTTQIINNGNDAINIIRARRQAEVSYQQSENT